MVRICKTNDLMSKLHTPEWSTDESTPQNFGGIKISPFCDRYIYIHRFEYLLIKDLNWHMFYPSPFTWS